MPLIMGLKITVTVSYQHNNFGSLEHWSEFTLIFILETETYLEELQ